VSLDLRLWPGDVVTLTRVRNAAIITLAAVFVPVGACSVTSTPGTASPVSLPYCAEEDGSGSPSAPCWWPANDRDILILSFVTEYNPPDSSD
jgi:hypothetical protein